MYFTKYCLSVFIMNLMCFFISIYLVRYVLKTFSRINVFFLVSRRKKQVKKMDGCIEG